MGRATPFHPTEVTGTDQREVVVAAYRRKLGRSVDRYFDVIPEASGHPVFRMDSVR